MERIRNISDKIEVVYIGPENPKETNIPTVFLLLKFYQYILIIVGGIFSYLFFKYLIRKKI